MSRMNGELPQARSAKATEPLSLRAQLLILQGQQSQLLDLITDAISLIDREDYVNAKTLLIWAKEECGGHVARELRPKPATCEHNAEDR